MNHPNMSADLQQIAAATVQSTSRPPPDRRNRHKLRSKHSCSEIWDLICSSCGLRKDQMNSKYQKLWKFEWFPGDEAQRLTGYCWFINKSKIWRYSVVYNLHFLFCFSSWLCKVGCFLPVLAPSLTFSLFVLIRTTVCKTLNYQPTSDFLLILKLLEKSAQWCCSTFSFLIARLKS